jgi:hypothetical protein
MAIAQPRSGQRVGGRTGVLENFGINARRVYGLLRVNDGDKCKRGDGASQGENAIPFRHAVWSPRHSMLNRSKAADSAQNQGTFTFQRALSLPSTVFKTIYNQHTLGKEECSGNARKERAIRR